MKDSIHNIGKEWLKDLPENWTYDRLKDLCEKVTGGGTPKSSVSEYWENGDITWVSPTDFSKQKNEKFITNSDKKITELGLQKSSAKILPKGTVIMSSRASIGEAKIAGKDLATNQGFTSFITSYKLNNNFLFYLIESHLGDYYLSIASGTTFFEISNRMVKLENIPLPPKQEQIAIATYLDEACKRLDRIIAIKEAQLKKLEDYFFTTITKYTSKGLGNSEIEKTNLLWIPEIKKGWKIKPLKRLLKSKLKYGANESAENEDKNEPRYIRITDFGKDGNLKKNTFKSLPKEVAAPFMLKDGDVLFARSGATVGKTFLFKDYDGEACFAGYLIKAECDTSKLLPKYLYYFTKSKGYIEWKNLIFTQATIQNIGADKYQYLRIPVPKTIDEQKEIVNKIEILKEKTDATIFKIKNQIKTLKAYRKSLIHECVTGKKQVATIASKKKEKASV